jgi:hypothetical protein
MICSPSAPLFQLSGEAVTFFTEDDSGKLRSVANMIRAAGGDVPEWMLTLKKERRRKKPSADMAEEEGRLAVVVKRPAKRTDSSGIGGARPTVRKVGFKGPERRERKKAPGVV